MHYCCAIALRTEYIKKKGEQLILYMDLNSSAVNRREEKACVTAVIMLTNHRHHSQRLA